MAGPTQPDVGEMHIDASGVVLKPVATEDRSRILKLRDDADEAMDTMMLLTPEEIERAGLNEGDVERLRSSIAEHRKVVMFQRAAERMAEKLRQTALSHGHIIAGLMGEVTAQGRRRARISPERGDILDALEPVIAYHTAPARKGWRTRAQQEAAEAALEANSTAYEARKAGEAP